MQLSDVSDSSSQTTNGKLALFEIVHLLDQKLAMSAWNFLWSREVLAECSLYLSVDLEERRWAIVFNHKDRLIFANLLFTVEYLPLACNVLLMQLQLSFCEPELNCIL